MILGGGRRHFFPSNTTDPEEEELTGSRRDDRDLVQVSTHNYGNTTYYIVVVLRGLNMT